MEYIKFFTDNMRNKKFSDHQDLLDKLKSLNEKLSGGDLLAGRISRVLATKLMMMISA